MKLSKEVLQQCLDRLTVLRQFPSGALAQAEIAKIIDEMSKNEKDARAIVDDALRGFDAWPGPVTFRNLRVRRPEYEIRSERAQWERDFR